jgi:predicted nucleotidyltransferase
MHGAQPVNRDQLLEELRRHRPEIEARFAVKHLSVFGSAARDELRADSDIDVLVEFNGKATFDGYMELKLYLEHLLGRNIDLVTHDAVKPHMRPLIEREAIHVT